MPSLACFWLSAPNGLAIAIYGLGRADADRIVMLHPPTQTLSWLTRSEATNDPESTLDSAPRPANHWDHLAGTGGTHAFLPWPRLLGCYGNGSVRFELATDAASTLSEIAFFPAIEPTTHAVVRDYSCEALGASQSHQWSRLTSAGFDLLLKRQRNCEGS